MEGDGEDYDISMSRLRRTDPDAFLSKQLGERNRNSLNSAIDFGVPPASLALLARWWQLETYLRQLLYIQLRALDGTDWQARLKKSLTRIERANQSSYMGSPDDQHLLAHVDVTDMFTIIDELWVQCSHGIGIPQGAWKAKIDEIKPIRHRLAHCRRPHSDDVDRVEQLLRDLEPGAQEALRSFTSWHESGSIRPNPADPVVVDWVDCQHSDANRLVEHGHSKGISFSLLATQLPWAEPSATVTGTPGCFWVMYVNLHGWHLYIDDYVTNRSVQNLMPVASHIVQTSPTDLAVILPAVTEHKLLSDTIGGLFDAVFTESMPGDDAVSVRHPWRRRQEVLDPRIDAAGLLAVLSIIDRHDPLPIFQA